MKNFTSYFLAIPLPIQFQAKFINLLKEIKFIQLSLQMVKPETPHVTLFYLTKEIEKNFKKVDGAIKANLDILKNSQLTIGGFGYFEKDNPKTIFRAERETRVSLFLNVESSPSIKVFKEKISKLLVDYSTKDNLSPFVPHLTLAAIKTNQAKKDFLDKRQLIEQYLEKISWSFNIEELVLYGADSKQQPEYQEKIIEFK